MNKTIPIQHGNLEALVLLISAGARVDQLDGHGETCLHHAVRSRTFRTLKGEHSMWSLDAPQTPLIPLQDIRDDHFREYA